MTRTRFLTVGLLIAFWMSTETFAQREGGRPAPAKKSLTIIALGHTDHGKSTLAAAITGVLSDRGKGRFVPYDQIADPSEITVQGVSVTAARIEYETSKRRYVHIDCQSHDDIATLLSSEGVKLDGAILVVSAADGPMPQTREHIRLARESGITSLVVYINKIDLMDDPELIELVELEIRELLTAHEFEGDAVTFVRGSALMALTRSKPEIGEKSILALLRAMDTAFNE